MMISVRSADATWRHTKLVQQCLEILTSRLLVCLSGCGSAGHEHEIGSRGLFVPHRRVDDVFLVALEVGVVCADAHKVVGASLPYHALEDAEVSGADPADPRRQSRTTNEALRWRRETSEHEVREGQDVPNLVARDAALTFEVADYGDEVVGEAISYAGVLPEPMLYGHDGRDGDLLHHFLGIKIASQRRRGEPRGDGVFQRNLVSQEGMDEVCLPFFNALPQALTIKDTARVL